MRLKPPVASFKPDPMLSADAVNRVKKKADNEATLNPGSGSDDSPAGASQSPLSKKLSSASTAMDVGASVVPHPKVKVALMAGSMACTAASSITQKFADSSGIGGPDKGQGDAGLKEAQASLVGLGVDASVAQQMNSSQATRAISIVSNADSAIQFESGGRPGAYLQSLDHTSDIAGSIPPDAGGLNPSQLEYLQSIRDQEQEQGGPQPG